MTGPYVLWPSVWISVKILYVQTIRWNSWGREEILQCKSILSGKNRQSCWGELWKLPCCLLLILTGSQGKNEAVGLSWLQVWKRNGAVANLASASSFRTICILFKAVSSWFCLFCLPIQPFLLMVCSTPALAHATASARNWWLSLYLLATVNANSYVWCGLCTGFMDLVSGRI